VVKLQTGSLK